MIYLDNAATTFPKPPCLCDGINQCIKTYCGNPGRSAHKLSLKSAEKIYETRTLLAEMFNSDLENVIFTYNTTYALNIAIKSLYKPNSHILISDIEHNSVYRPVYKLKEEGLCLFDIFSTTGSDENIIEEIKSKLKPNSKMLVCAHVSNVGVRRLPIKEIGDLCKEKGITFIVDAAQSAGIYPIDVKNMNISVLCMPAHKGLYGPQGLGIAIFNDVNGKSVFEGGTGINSLEPRMPDFLPEMYEPGTMSTPLIAGLCESLKWLKELSISSIRLYEEELYKEFISKLTDINELDLYLMNSYFGNTILFNIKNISPNIVGNELNKCGICVRSGFHCSYLAHKTLGTIETGAVRMSLSVFNTKKEIATTCIAIKKIINDKKIRL